MLLNVVSVTSGYGRVRIVSGVSLGVDEGEISRSSAATVSVKRR